MNKHGFTLALLDVLTGKPKAIQHLKEYVEGTYIEVRHPAPLVIQIFDRSVNGASQVLEITIREKF